MRRAGERFPEEAAEYKGPTNAHGDHGEGRTAADTSKSEAVLPMDMSDPAQENVPPQSGAIADKANNKENSDAIVANASQSAEHSDLPYQDQKQTAGIAEDKDDIKASVQREDVAGTEATIDGARTITGVQQGGKEASDMTLKSGISLRISYVHAVCEHRDLNFALCV